MSTSSSAVVSVTTRSVCMPPLLGCLQVSEQILGSPLNWQPNNDLQTCFVSQVLPAMPDLAKFTADEFSSIASLSSVEVEHFLADRGFPMPVDPFGPDEFGVASVMNVLVTWLVPGEEDWVSTGSGNFPAFELEDGITFFRVGGHSQPVAAIQTENGDEVFITVAGRERTDFELLEHARTILSGEREHANFTALVCPMVDYDADIDIGWIVGLSTASPKLGVRARVVSAQQKTRFRMNERGARAESAAQMTMRLEACIVRANKLVIDRPFIVIMRRPGAVLPYFVGVFAEDVWKRPEQL